MFVVVTVLYCRLSDRNSISQARIPPSVIPSKLALALEEKKC